MPGTEHPLMPWLQPLATNMSKASGRTRVCGEFGGKVYTKLPGMGYPRREGMQRGQMSDKLYSGWSVYRVETLTAEGQC
jgi:hypothetical protein